MKKGQSRNDPFTVAPDDWHEKGLPYGAFCECSECGLVERSTMLFDFYADKPGDKLVCETCQINTPHSMVAPVIKEAEKRGVYDSQG